ncbi:DUF2889 domain-containing protein [Pseudoduganella umbonata]|nr:DUF2889 domain-containing protein [Pseudoduganella umbonata]
MTFDESLHPQPQIGGDVSREELHFRRIDMRGFRRSDGLYEVESRLVDRKPRDFASAYGSRQVPAGEPLHDLGVRLVFDEQLTVCAVQTFTDAAPYGQCPEGGLALQSIKGMRMTRGWSKAVRAKLGGAASCTHLMELLMPMATVAFQSLSMLRKGKAEPLDADGRPLRIDSCYAYGAKQELVLRYWPEFYRAEEPR